MRPLRFAARMGALALLFGLPVTLSIAQENTNSAIRIMRGCREFIKDNSSEDWFMQGVCSGRISGVEWSADKVCSPRESTHGQSVRVVVAYIERRPERMHESFNELALEALIAAWPCARR